MSQEAQVDADAASSQLDQVWTAVCRSFARGFDSQAQLHPTSARFGASPVLSRVYVHDTLSDERSGQEQIGAEGGSKESRRGTGQVSYGPKQSIGGRRGVHLAEKYQLQYYYHSN